MPALTTTALRTQLASGETASIYVLLGADEAEKHAVANEFVDTVDEGLRAFNVDRFYGGDIKVETLLDAAANAVLLTQHLTYVQDLMPDRPGLGAAGDRCRAPEIDNVGHDGSFSNESRNKRW